MVGLLRFGEDFSPSVGRKKRAFVVILSLMLFTAFSGLGQNESNKPTTPAANGETKIKEELILKNGDRLTGQLLNSTGTEIRFKSDLAGEVTVEWNNIQELKTARGFAVIPKNIRDARNNTLVPEGAIQIRDNGVIVYPAPKGKSNTTSTPAVQNGEVSTSAVHAPPAKKIPLSSVGFVVDDATYQRQIHQKIHWKTGWEGHIATGSTMVLSTQNSYLFHMDIALRRTVPTVGWLNPKLRTKINFTLSAGEATQADAPKTTTNIYHADAERDRYFSPQGYFLQMFSLDHNNSQGLFLQQNYGVGIGATVFKRVDSEFDVSIDLHYANQQFNATADVSEFDLNLIGTSLTEAYMRRWGKVRLNEKLLADVAFNDPSAFSASGISSMRLPVYKRLGFNASVIDNFLNNPQVGFKKNSLEFSTGLSWILH